MIYPSASFASPKTAVSPPTISQRLLKPLALFVMLFSASISPVPLTRPGVISPGTSRALNSPPSSRYPVSVLSSYIPFAGLVISKHAKPSLPIIFSSGLSTLSAVSLCIEISFGSSSRSSTVHLPILSTALLYASPLFFGESRGFCSISSRSFVITRTSFPRSRPRASVWRVKFSSFTPPAPLFGYIPLTAPLIKMKFSPAAFISRSI